MFERIKAERHTHDCEACIYLGSIHITSEYAGVSYEDVYYCATSISIGGLGTIISRRSSEPSDYMSISFRQACVGDTSYDRAVCEAVQKILDSNYIVLNPNKVDVPKETLRDWVPTEFLEEFMDTPAAKLLDYELIDKVTLEHKDFFDCPIDRQHIHNWCKVSNGKKTYAVAWNENPSRGWSFPIKRIDKC